MHNLSQTSGAQNFSVDVMSSKDIVFAVFELLADLGNIAGNVVIVVLIYKDNQLKSLASRLLVNQAVADGSVGILYILAVFFLIISDSTTDFHSALTSFRTCLTVAYSESLQTLGATAYSLYVAICYPIKFRIYNKKWTASAFIVSSWIMNFVIGCLIFVADDTFKHDDFMLYSFYRHEPKHVWYEVLKMAAMFLPSLLGVVCFVKVCIYKRAIRRGDVQAHPNTTQLVGQSLGVLFMMSLYVLALSVQILGENIFPITKDDTNMMPILSFLVYLYLVLKLPLFLFVFKPYRHLARELCCPFCCRARVHPLPNQNAESVTSNTGVDLLECDSSILKNRNELSKQDCDQQHAKRVPTRPSQQDTSACTAAQAAQGRGSFS